MRVQRVLMPGSEAESWTVLGDDQVPLEPVERFLGYLTSIEKWRPATSVDSDHTRITGHRRNPDGDEVPEVRRRL